MVPTHNRASRERNHAHSLTHPHAHAWMQATDGVIGVGNKTIGAAIHKWSIPGDRARRPRRRIAGRERFLRCLHHIVDASRLRYLAACTFDMPNDPVSTQLNL